MKNAMAINPESPPVIPCCAKGGKRKAEEMSLRVCQIKKVFKQPRPRGSGGANSEQSEAPSFILLKVMQFESWSVWEFENVIKQLSPNSMLSFLTIHHNGCLPL